MNLKDIKTTIRQNSIFYITGFLIIFGMKYFYSKADCDMLKWILTPTTRWVSILSGIPFLYESGTGYVNYSLKYVIASSCSGVSFMIITTAMLIFSFLHHFHRPSGKLGWMAGCMAFSYLFTIFINGLRIILAIYIPLYLEGKNIYGRYLTPDSLHTLIGTVVYFTALLVIYNLTGCLFQKTTVRFVSPVFWYFLIVLTVPFFNRLYRNDLTGFSGYAALITVVCLTVLLPFFIIHLIKRL